MSINTKAEAIMISIIISELTEKGVDMIEEVGIQRLTKVNNIIRNAIPDTKGYFDREDVVQAIISYIDGTSEELTASKQIQKPNVNTNFSLSTPSKSQAISNDSSEVTVDDLMIIAIIGNALRRNGIEILDELGEDGADYGVKYVLHTLRLSEKFSAMATEEGENECLVRLYKKFSQKLL